MAATYVTFRGRAVLHRGVMKRRPHLPLFDELKETAVFRVDALDPRRKTNATYRAVGYHVTGGRLTQLRRGLYAQTAMLGALDPYTVAACLTTDGIIAYASALEFHLFPKKAPRHLYVLSRERLGTTKVRGVTYQGVYPPRPLHDGVSYGGFVTRVERQGVKVVVTSLERSFVDCLDRTDLLPLPELLGHWKRAQSLEVNDLVRYAKRLGNRVAAARLGLLLSKGSKRSSADLLALEAMRPATAAYFDPRDHSKGQTFVARWNLLVPGRFAKLVR